MLLQVSLFVILLVSSGGTPYYITSSDDIFAGNNISQLLEPCSTLETLAANYKSITSDDFGENLTLLFLSGNYVVQNMTHLNFTSFQTISLSPLNESENFVSDRVSIFSANESSICTTVIFELITSITSPLVFFPPQE